MTDAVVAWAPIAVALMALAGVWVQTRRTTEERGRLQAETARLAAEQHKLDAEAVDQLVSTAKGLLAPLQARIAEQENQIARLEGEVMVLTQRLEEAMRLTAALAVVENERDRLQAETARLHALLPPRHPGNEP